DHLYVLYDRGLLSCFDARTGKALYENERLEGQFTASPWAYGGKVFCLNEDGVTHVIEAGPKFRQLGKNDLDEMCMATPAALRGSLLVRTLTRLYRIENRPDPQGPPGAGEQYGAPRTNIDVGKHKGFILSPAKLPADGSRPWVW